MPADQESEAGGEQEPGEGARAAERRHAGHGEGVRRGAPSRGLGGCRVLRTGSQGFTVTSAGRWQG